MSLEHCHRRPAEEGRGTLVLIGGAASPDGEALDAFLDACHENGARDGEGIFVFTTASESPARAAKLWKADFRTAGARKVATPVVASREDAMDRELAERVRDARAVFLGGGDQVKLVACLSGTPLGDAIREVYMHGGVVGGTSAGAAALTATTMAGGELDLEGNLVEMYVGPGLGLLGWNCVIDTHFAQRRRLQRLFVMIAQYPTLMGIGLDEDTALLVRGRTGEVFGKGGVFFVDGRDTVRYDNKHEVALGRQLTMSHLRVGIVGSGHRLDLEARELSALVEAGAAVPAGVLRERRRGTRGGERAGGSAGGRAPAPSSVAE